MLSNAYFLAKFRFDTAENEPAKNLQNFRKMHSRKMHFRKMHFRKARDVRFDTQDQLALQPVVDLSYLRAFCSGSGRRKPPVADMVTKRELEAASSAVVRLRGLKRERLKL